MEINNETIPTDAFPEDANMNLKYYNHDKITVEQQLSIQQPKPEEYVSISKWDLDKIRKRCNSLMDQPKLRSDIALTIGSILLGAFASAIFSGVDFTQIWWLLAIFILLPVVGCVAMSIAYFWKKEEHDDAKKVADDIEEIITHIYQEDREVQRK